MRLSTETLSKIDSYEAELVRRAEELAGKLKEDKERQLRNIQQAAEQTKYWEPLALFIRYQAARKQLDKEWTKQLIKELEDLQGQAKEIARETRDNPDLIHMELIARLMGYLVRWHKVITEKVMEVKRS